MEGYNITNEQAPGLQNPQNIYDPGLPCVVVLSMQRMDSPDASSRPAKLEFAARNRNPRRRRWKQIF